MQFIEAIFHSACIFRLPFLENFLIIEAFVPSCYGAFLIWSFFLCMQAALYSSCIFLNRLIKKTLDEIIKMLDNKSHKI